MYKFFFKSLHPTGGALDRRHGLWLPSTGPDRRAAFLEARISGIQYVDGEGGEREGGDR